jgi:hypothetical protein
MKVNLEQKGSSQVGENVSSSFSVLRNGWHESREDKKHLLPIRSNHPDGKRTGGKRQGL